MKKFYKYISYFCISSIPFLTTFLGVLVNIFPFKLDHLNLMPLIPAITIYFWSIYKPKSLSYFSILFLGVFKDILENNIIGLSALWFLVFRAAISFQRNYIHNNSFLVVWFGFIFFLSLTLVVPLVLLRITNDTQVFKIIAIFIQWVITCFAYIPMHWILSKFKNLDFNK